MKPLFAAIFLIPIFLFSQNLQDQEKIRLANEYFQQGELEKSRTMYEELASNPYNVPLISSNYLSLLKSEARHYEDYLKLAKTAAADFSESNAGKVDVRVGELLEAERQLILSEDEQFRFHSGPLAAS